MGFSSQLNLSESGKDSGGGHSSIESLLILAFFGIVMAYSFFGALLEHKEIHFLHESGLAIILGAIVALIAKLSFKEDVKLFHFDENFFFLFVLPSILFAAGYTLKKKRFFRNFTYISLFGVLGTLVNFALTTLGTYLISKSGFIYARNYFGDSDLSVLVNFQPSEIMLLSATLCSSDTVAALTMIKYKEQPKLFSLVFGEGIVNDAVSIILFHTVKHIFTSNEVFKWTSPFMITLDFVKMSVLSVLIGLIVGIVSSYFFRKFRFLTNQPIVEITLVFFFGFSSYYISENFELSGVISLLISGVLLGHYNWYNLSDEGKVTTGFTFQTISLISEAFLFAYLGVTSLSTSQLKISVSFIALETLVVCLARYGSIFILAGIIKLVLGKKFNLDVYELLVMSFAGVIRGAIAFALILKLEKVDLPNKEVVITSTLGIVLFTTIILGALMPKYLRIVLSRQTRSFSTDSTEFQQFPGLNNGNINQDIPQAFMISNNQPRASRIENSRVRRLWKKFDETYFKPLLIHDYNNLKLSMQGLHKQKYFQKEEQLIQDSADDQNNNEDESSTRNRFSLAHVITSNNRKTQVKSIIPPPNAHIEEYSEEEQEQTDKENDE